MSTSITNPTSNRTGLCPHGLVPSACPICSGGGMGGAAKTRDSVMEKSIRSNEWSWIKCYAAGLALKAKDARIENAKTVFERQIEFAKLLNKTIQEIADKIKNAIQNIENNIPKSIFTFLNFIANNIIFPLLNLAVQIPKLIEKFALFQQLLGNFLLNVSEKLAALFGDLKNFIDKKLTENIKRQAKKIFLFFMSNMEEENYKNDETLSIFKSREIKKYLINVVNKIRKRNKNAG